MQRSCCLRDVDLVWNRNATLIHWRDANIEVEMLLSLSWSNTNIEVGMQTSLCWRNAALLFCQGASFLQSEDAPFAWCRNTTLGVTNVNLLQSRDVTLLGNRGPALLFCQGTSHRILKRRGLWSGDATLTLLKWRRLRGRDENFSLLKRRSSIKYETHVLRALSRVWKSIKRHYSLKMQGLRSGRVATRLVTIGLKIWAAYLGRLPCL